MILATRNGDRALRSSGSFGALINSRSGRAAGVVVNGTTVSGIPAAGAAISYAAYAVAALRMRVWRGEGFERTRVRNTWQARFFAGMPNEREPWVSVWAKTEGCLTARNNAYWLKAKDDKNRVAAVYVLAPDSVGARWNDQLHRPEYRVQYASGRWSPWIGSDHVLHFRAIGDPADAQSVIARTPIEIYRESLGAAIAKIKHESSFYENGVRNSLAVTFPKEVKPEEARQWRELYQAEHGGLANAHGVRVFGGGADLSTVGLSLADSQFIESVQMSLEDSARIFRMLSSLIGGGSQSQVSKPISPEHEMTRWLRLLGPRLGILEGWIQADPDFFGPGARDEPGFDQTGVVRGDLTTEADISLKKVQSGQWLVDEARAKDGLPPLPGGVGKIPQIVPVGGGQNPVTPPLDDDEEGERARLSRQPLHVHLRQEPITVNVPPQTVEIRVPEQPAPVVQVDVAPAEVRVPEQPVPVIQVEVAAPAVTIESPKIDVHVPEQPAPVVKVENTIENTIDLPARKVTFERNGQGQIKGAKVEDS